MAADSARPDLVSRFPQDRVDGDALVRSARLAVVHDDEDGHLITVESGDFEVEVSFPVDVTGSPEEKATAPDRVLEILRDLRTIDNIVQARLAAEDAGSGTGHRFDPVVLYVENDGSAFVDYWCQDVNSQWDVTLQRTAQGWRPIL